ncbi:YybH family protein [Tsuneonella sp. HG249]
MLITAIMAAALAAQLTPDAHTSQAASVAEQSASLNADESAVRTVLAQYKSAIERLDATGTEELFTEDSAVFETGGVEGSYKEYLAHHLGAELAAFRTFTFSDYKVTVRIEGDLALATETYNYRIEPKTGETATRKGVATSVLKRTAEGWKILVMHNSARKPKGA